MTLSSSNSELAGQRAFVVSDMLGEKAGSHVATLLLCRQLQQLDLRVDCFAVAATWDKRMPDLPFAVSRPWLRRGWRWDWPGKCLAWQVMSRIRSEKPRWVFVVGLTRLSSYLLSSDVAEQLIVWELTNATPGNKHVNAVARQLLGRCRAVLSPSQTIDQNIRINHGCKGRILRLPFWIEEVEGEEQKAESRKQKPEDGRQRAEGRGQRTEDRGQKTEVRSQWAEIREGGKLKAESGEQKGHESDLRSPVSGLRSPRSASADFIFLGRRDVEKGLHELVRATVEVAKQFPGVRVLIAGPGSEAPFAAAARELGVGGNIQFQFFRTREDTMAALKRSLWLVLPSYHEGYPLVLLEAAQSGVPFIATSVGSVPELYRESAAAILIPPRNHHALAEAMLHLMSESTEQYNHRRDAARAAFHRLSSAGSVRAQLLALLLTLPHPEL